MIDLQTAILRGGGGRVRWVNIWIFSGFFSSCCLQVLKSLKLKEKEEIWVVKQDIYI